jgi:hypothetical protein
VIPQGFVLDPLTVSRLHEQLHASPDDVSGVIAPTGMLPPGASYRSHAEHRSLQPLDAVFVTDEPVPGAALVRSAASHRLEGASLVVDRGRVLVDPGCHAHDPEVSTDPVEDAVPEGRSPFPRRPIVLFVALEPDVGQAVWARNLVNDLLAHDTEARLATVSNPGGRHLTRPCRPSRETVRALQPDVVIALDDTAAEQVPSWCDRRSTAVIHHTGERTLSTELVSWRIGEGTGRLRALIGGAVDAPTLTALCSRLCGMPPPVPPDDEEPVVAPPRVRVARDRLTVAVVRDTARRADGDRLDAFLAEARAIGERASVFDSADALSAVDCDAVLLSDTVDAIVGEELISARSAAGRRTLVDVASPDSPSGLVLRAGGATAPTLSIRSSLESRGVPTRLLPNLLTRTRLNELQRARVGRRADDPLVLGVRVDIHEAPPLDALSTALDELVRERPELTVERVGPEELRPVEHVRHWTAQVWISSSTVAGLAGRPAPLVESGYAGIPTAFDAACRGDVYDTVIGRFAIDDPLSSDEWMTRLRAILDVTKEDRQHLWERADLLFGRTASRSIVNRLLGWASHTGCAR